MKIVGYLEGTDPLLLTKLSVKGIGVLPLGNGYDSHGKYIGNLEPTDNIGVVVGYVHKVLHIIGQELGPKDMLSTCIIHKIPIVLIAAEEDVQAASDFLSAVKENVTIVSPEKAFDTITQKLKKRRRP
jgi:hypothetical protein